MHEGHHQLQHIAGDWKSHKLFVIFSFLVLTAHSHKMRLVMKEWIPQYEAAVCSLQATHKEILHTVDSSLTKRPS